ncbi:MAG: hypothetical protein JRD89_01960 [Deltaproteobacteria bacterium]|nr:hypothetical protein [Deltaproteobacteria bacterium]
MEIIRHRQHHSKITYQLAYSIPNTGCGYSFNCDQDGSIDVDNMNPDAQQNYEYCLLGVNERSEPIVPGKVREIRKDWTDPPVGLCICGHEVELGGFTNTCEDCGEDYNSAGQHLAPREQWGIETGEHPTDIRNIK